MRVLSVKWRMQTQTAERNKTNDNKQSNGIGKMQMSNGKENAKKKWYEKILAFVEREMKALTHAVIRNGRNFQPWKKSLEDTHISIWASFYGKKNHEISNCEIQNSKSRKLFIKMKNDKTNTPSTRNSFEKTPHTYTHHAYPEVFICPCCLVLHCLKSYALECLAQWSEIVTANAKEMQTNREAGIFKFTAQNEERR